MKFAWLAIFIALSIIGLTAGQPMTLPEHVRANKGRPVDIERVRELMSASLDVVVKGAALVVHGYVRPVKTYLSDDEKDLYTDYQVTPVRMLYQRTPTRSSTPGQIQQIIVQAWGGYTTIDGVKVSVVDRNLPPFEDGTELVLILRPFSSGKYRIAEGISGVLRVKNGRITSVPDGLKNKELVGLSIAEFETTIHKLVQ